MSIDRLLINFELLAEKYGDINELLEETWWGKFQGVHGNCVFWMVFGNLMAANDDYLGDRDGTSARGPEPLADLCFSYLPWDDDQAE